MSADNIRSAATGIAARLKSLPDITEFYPHYREISTLGNGEGFMTPVGFTLPETMGENTFQQVTWSCRIRLESTILSPADGSELNTKITNLCSADPARGVIGALRYAGREFDRQNGSPRVTQDGIDPDYDEEQDDSILTVIGFDIIAQIRMVG